LLVLLAIPLSLVGLRWLRTMSRARAVSVVVARSLLIALIAMSLAGAARVRTSDRLAVIAVIDVSGSVKQFADFGKTSDGRRRTPTQAIRDWLERAAGDRGRDDLLGVVVFDGDSLALATPSPPSSRTNADSSLGWRLEDLPLDLSMAQGTDIAEALRYAAALLPPDARKRLLLISDGDATTGDAQEAANEIASTSTDHTMASIPIDTLPISYRVDHETMIEFVDAPPGASRDSLVTVRVGFRSTQPTTGTLRLTHEGAEIDLNGDAPGSGLRISLRPGRQVVPVEVRLPSQTVHRFRAFFEPDDATSDSIATNNTGEAFTVTPGKGAILVVDGVSDGSPTGAGAILPNTLRKAGLAVETIPPGATPTDLLSLQDYDLILLQNVAADEIPRGAQSILASYVRDMGGGLAMIGGPDSFGAGGWNGGEVEKILPVEMDLPEDLIIPSAAIVIVLDSSGSMGRNVLGGMRTQQEIANEAAALAIQTLDPQDLVGVIEFDNSQRLIVPLAPNIDPAASAKRVRAIAPDGGTNLYPALAHAGASLRDVKAQVKLIIVLSDGQSQGSAIYGQNLAAQFSQEGVKVSTIAVGDGADTETLQAIARAGNGQYYRVIDPYTLPQIFIREVRVVRKPMIREGVFEPVRTSAQSPITTGLPDPLPTLRGMVLTQPKNDPRVINAIMAPTGQPILSHWNIGLGQSAAWTSDASRWADAWINTPAYETLWTQLARTISRPVSSQQYDVGAEVRDGVLHIRVDAADDAGDPLDMLTIPGWVYAPNGERRKVELSQTGPGVYEAEVEANETGAYITALTPRLGAKRLPPIVAGAATSTSPEYRRLHSDITLLKQLSEATGGRVLSWDLPETADLFDRTDLAPSVALTPIWPTLVLWTVAVMLLDVGTRRIAWDRILSRELAAALRQHADEAIRERGDQAAATLGRLHRRAEKNADSPLPARSVQTPLKRKPIVVQAPADEADRRKSIREALKSYKTGPGTSQSSKSKKVGTPEDSSEARTPPENLLAAKRRAQKRFESEEDRS